MLRSRLFFTFTVSLLICIISLTLSSLASQVRFGLEFRGGYEIYYVVSPVSSGTEISQQDLLKTVNVLRQRADTIGMAEPEIHIEGKNHIRVKLAGLTSANESRSLLSKADGLPTLLTEKYSQTVGSVLGSTALHDTVMAGIIGISCIFALLIVLYRGLGLIAALCTIVYLWILIILFTASQATLSLSSVVAFVLGIGMAADASIICFERVGEHLAKGIVLRQAIDQGFKESFPTIRDANFVTALAMIVLFIAGIGPIQGFALTMLVSIFISICTNFFLIKKLCLWLVDAQWIPEYLVIKTSKSKLFSPSSTFNFVQFGKLTIILSLLTIMIGTLYYRAHGLNLDIDFTAGTALDIDIDRKITQDLATKIMSDAGTVPATLAVGGKNNQHIAARFDEVLPSKELKRIIQAFQTQYTKVEYEENTADPGVARDFAKRSLYAIVAAFISIIIFIAWRFSWSIAVATLFPILLDIALVSAIFSLFKLEIDVTYIAGLLTIIGYSLNDKMVIFRRIMENIQLSSFSNSESLQNIVNFSIQQTLGRSLYTVLTVILASTSLYWFACEPLQMFALAILLGLIAAAYSSIFMSTSIWLFLTRNLFLTAATDQRNDRNFLKRSTLIIIGTIFIIGIGGWITIPRMQIAHPAKNMQYSAESPLGDLSLYRDISYNTLSLVQKGDFHAAKKRITDLETEWDNAEESLQPMSPRDWTGVDKAIDRALAKIRSGQPNQEECLITLETLLAKIDSIQHKK